MKVFVYKNGMCDPKVKLGLIKKFSKAEDVDGFIRTFCVSMSPIANRQYRIFITNDEVEQHEVDHKVIMGDNYSLDMRQTSIKEIDTLETAAECNDKLAKALASRKNRIQLERNL